MTRASATLGGMVLLAAGVLGAAGHATIAGSGSASFFSPQQKGTITGVVVATRTDQEGGHSILFEASSSLAGQLVDQIRVKLPKNAAQEISPHLLPPQWDFALKGRELILTGPPLQGQQKIYINLDIGAVTAPANLEVQLLSQGRRLLKKRVPVSLLPPLRVAKSLDELMVMPRVVSPGEQIQFEALDPERTPGPGSWTVAGVEAEELAKPPATQVAGSPAEKPRYTLHLPDDLKLGDPIEVAYTDPWGDRIVYVPAVEDVVVVLASAGVSPKPMLTACTPRAFPGNTICVCGWFPDETAWNSLTLNGEPLGAPVSAASRTVYVRLPAEMQPGPHVIAGDPAAGFSSSDTAQVTVLVVGGEIDRNKLLRGEDTKLRLWVQGTEERISLHLRNTTPGIVSLEGGQDQVVTTSGGADNRLEELVHAVSPGDFTIIYELDADSCPCDDHAEMEFLLAADETHEEPIESIAADTTGVAVVTPAATGTATKPCPKTVDDCEELRRRAEQKEAEARAARAAAERAAQEQRWHDSEATAIDETSKKDWKYAQTLRRQAAEWRELARDAERDARTNRRRARDYPGRGWEEAARSDEARAKERKQRADELEAQAEALEERTKGQAEQVADLQGRADAALADAIAKAKAAAEARAAYEACLDQVRKGCETKSTLASTTGPSVVTSGCGETVDTDDDDGDDPRDTGEDAMVCGPDITDYVLKVLDEMIDAYDAADETTKKNACRNIVSTDTAEFSWDMFSLSPLSAPPTEGPKPGEKYWFEDISPRCAKPRYPCGPTVVFFGQCIHAQVVNYVQWGVMNKLCDQEGYASLVHWGRATAGARWRSLEFKTAHYEGQKMMTYVGSSFVSQRRLADADPDFKKDPSRYTPEWIKDFRKDVLRELSDEKFGAAGSDSDWAKRGEAACQMICPSIEAVKKALDRKLWGFHWMGLEDKEDDVRRRR